MFAAASALGDKLGLVLFQLPPNFAVDLERLRAFISLIPPGVRAAFEFRHPSWTDHAVTDILSDHNLALCVVDTDEEPGDPVRTADWGYIRLRRREYDDGDLDAWATRILRVGWSDTFVFFKHEDDGAGPAMASRFLALLHS